MSTTPNRKVLPFVSKVGQDGNFKKLSEFVGQNIVIYHAQKVRLPNGDPYKVVASVGIEYSDEQFYMFIGQTQPMQIINEVLAMGQLPVAFGVLKEKNYFLLVEPLEDVDENPF